MISSSGSCFVKYATSVEADRAIRALDNQYTFPGVSYEALLLLFLKFVSYQNKSIND